MKAWSTRELDKVDNEGYKLVVDKGFSIRKASERIQSKYFKNRSVESIRHKLREFAV